MENSKLLTLLQTFKSSELREFKDFVASPYFNKNKELVLFYAYLRKHAPHFPPAKIERLAIYKALFPNKPYDEKHLNYLMSFLLKLAEEYVGLKKYQTTKTLGEYQQLSSFVERDLDKHFHYSFNKATRSLDKSPFRNMDFYRQQYLLADVAAQYFANQKIRKHDSYLQQAANNFDLYYLANKLKYCCELLNRQKLVKGEYELKMIDEIQAFLTLHPHENIPAIAIYHQILMTLTKEDAHHHFEKLKELLLRYQEKFPNQERKEMLLYALNFCIRQANSGKQNYIEEAFNLYFKGIESELLFENGYLSPWAFKNVIRSGLMLKRYDWVENFIDKYNKKQAPEFRQNGFHYNMADLYYSKKEFNIAHQHLAQVEFTDIYINLDSKKMLMKIYFESGEIEALLSSIASFNIFLKRNKIIAPNVRDHYKNFTTMLGLMAKQGYSSASLKKKLDGMKSIADRNWLKKMIGEH